MSTDKNNTLLPIKREYLYDEEAKIGSIHFTPEEKKELLKLTTSKGWNVLRNVYLKQRLVQLAVTSMGVSTDERDLWFFQGRSEEANHMFKYIDMIAKQLQQEQDKKTS